MQETESIDEYILQHIDPESDYLKSLYRDTPVLNGVNHTIYEK